MVMLAMASRFLTATEFFPYHAEASGLQWGDLQPGLQTVILALLRVAGAGWLTGSVALIVLLAVPFARRDEGWSYVAIPALALIFWGITFATTLHVAMTTAANPPWQASLFCVGLTLASALLAWIARRTADA
jgi:hypothetical protein